MAPAMRRVVKPTIEIMEALPTVILGFLAGLWFALFVEKNSLRFFSKYISNTSEHNNYGFNMAKNAEIHKANLSRGMGIFITDSNNMHCDLVRVIFRC